MGFELESWLARKLERGGLIGLPLYRAGQEPVGRRPEAYARDLLAALRGEAASPIDAKGLLREVRAFRAWVESRPRGVAWTRRSRIDLEEPEFDSLRGRDEIHRYLEAIAHPDPNGPGFVVTPPLSREERWARRRAALAKRRVARDPRVEAGKVAVAFLILNTIVAVLIGVFVSQRIFRSLEELAGVLALVAILFLASVCSVIVRCNRARLERLLAQEEPARSYGPATDPWLDEEVGSSKAKRVAR